MQVESTRQRGFSHRVKRRTHFSGGAAALARILRYAYMRDTDEQRSEGPADKDPVRRRGCPLLNSKRYVADQRPARSRLPG